MSAPHKGIAKRNQLLKQQNGLCFYCMLPIRLGDETLEHLVPKSKGGSKKMKNLVVACSQCNLDVDNFLSVADLDGYYDKVVKMIEAKEREILLRGLVVVKNTLF